MGLHVLVVDDHADLRFLVKTLLTNDGFEVDEADSVETALVRAAQTRPRVIVLDNELGEDVKGVDIAAQLKDAVPSTHIFMYANNLYEGSTYPGVEQVINKMTPVHELVRRVEAVA